MAAAKTSEEITKYRQLPDERHNEALYSFDGKKWTISEGDKQIETLTASFFSQNGIGVMKDLVEQEKYTWSALAKCGNDPLTNKGYLVYKINGEDIYRFSGLLQMLDAGLTLSAPLEVPKDEFSDINKKQKKK